MSTFPIIKYPERIINLSNNFTEYLLKKYDKQIPLEPKYPHSPQKPAFEFAWVIFIAFGIAVLVFLLTKDSSIANPAFLIGLIVYPIIHMIRLSNYENSKVEYNKTYESYSKLRDKYSSQKQKIEKDKKNIQQNIHDTNWLELEYKKHLKERLKPIKLAIIEYSNPQKGKAETYFHGYLNRIFSNEIFTDKVIEIFTYKDKGDNLDSYDYDEDSAYKLFKTENAYCPDFIFTHNETKLTIDIEIDEPYNNSKKPIHTFNNEHDEKRNKYFTDLNWFVIRFSERKILNSPESCCLEIANLIYDLTGDDRYFTHIKTDKLLNRDKIWTYKEAEVLATNNKRRNYDDFNELFLNLDSKLLLSPLKCGNKKYTFNREFEFIEYDLFGEKVLDKGLFKIIKVKANRYRIDINWKDGIIKYYMNNLDENNLVLTEEKTGIQYKFERLN